MAPLLQAALFYAQTAAGDLLAAQREISALQAACAQVTLRPGEARARLEAFIARRARDGRGIPAAPHPGKIPGAVTADGIAQAPDRALIGLLAGTPGGLWYHHARLGRRGRRARLRARRPEHRHVPRGPDPGGRGGPGWTPPRCEPNCSTSGRHAGSSSPTYPACATPRNGRYCSRCNIRFA